MSETCAINGLKSRPALGLEDARDRLAVGGVGGQPVDGLGGDRHQPARLQNIEGRSKRLIGMDDFGQGQTFLRGNCRGCGCPIAGRGRRQVRPGEPFC